MGKPWGIARNPPLVKAKLSDFSENSGNQGFPSYRAHAEGSEKSLAEAL
jgi:hypothetical protein